MRSIQIATERHQVAIADLVVSSYAAAKEFELTDLQEMRDICLKSEPGKMAMVALDGEKIESVMHGTLCSKKSEVRTALYCEDELPMIELPTFVNYRAATIPERRRSGLHHLLRLHFLNFALELKAKHLVSSVYVGASRLSNMEKFGYVFHPRSSSDDILVGRTEENIAVLDLERLGASARAMLLQMTTELQREYPLITSL